MDNIKSLRTNSESVTLCSHFWSMESFIHSLSSPMVATRGLGFPKGTQLKNNNIIDTKLHSDHIICGSTVSCYQKNIAAAIFTHTSTGAIKSINPLIMIYMFYLGLTHLPLVSSVTCSAVRKKSPFHTETTHYHCNEGLSLHYLLAHREPNGEPREAGQYTS